MSLQELVQRILPICGHYSLICRFIEGTVLDIAAVYSVALLCDKVVVIVCLRTSFEKNVVLKHRIDTQQLIIYYVYCLLFINNQVDYLFCVLK